MFLHFCNKEVLDWLPIDGVEEVVRAPEVGQVEQMWVLTLTRLLVVPVQILDHGNRVPFGQVRSRSMR